MKWKNNFVSENVAFSAFGTFPIFKAERITDPNVKSFQSIQIK